MEQDKTISELITSINNSLDYLSKDENNLDNASTLSNFDILVKGVDGEKGITEIFSPKVDNLLGKLFDYIIYGDFDSLIANEGAIKEVSDLIFGKGSFEGPVPTRVFNSIQNTMSSQKYIEMKSKLGKSITTMRKINMILKNLKREKKNIHNAEELKKYKEALYTIKQILKISAKVYSARKHVNQRMINGLNIIVHDK